LKLSFAFGRRGFRVFLPAPQFVFALILVVPSHLAASDFAARPSSSPRLLDLAPAGDLVSVPGTSAQAEVLSFPPSLAKNLAAVAVGESVTLAGWPVAPGERADVEVVRREVYSPDAEIWEIGPRGKRRVPRSGLVFLWGKAEDPESPLRVMVSVDPATGEVRGLAVTPAGSHELSPVPAAWKAGSRYVVGPRDLFLDTKGEAAEKQWSCSQEAIPDALVPAGSGVPAPVPAELAPIFGSASISSLHKVTVAVDTDNQVMANKFGNSAATANNYIAQLFAQMNVIYERDLNVRLLIGTTFLRTATDPYTVGDTAPYNDSDNLAKLQELTNVWTRQHADVARGLAILLSGRGAGGNSGIAWIDTLCDKGQGYAYNRVYTTGTSPNFADVQLVAHEIGHIFGSPHTHCYNTIGLTNPDNCSSGESYNHGMSCFTGTPSCPNRPNGATYNGVTGVQGTLMSYCHILNGCSASLVMHPTTVDLLDDIVLGKTTGSQACVFPATSSSEVLDVTGVEPRSGPVAGGTLVTLTGSGFAPGATVTFGGTAGTSVVVVDSTRITVRTPGRPTGVARVLVTNPDSGSSLSDQFFFYAPPATSTGFYTVTPCRLVDTRNAAGPRGGPSLQANAGRTFPVAGACDIPRNAKAISANLTVVAGPATGSFSLYPGNAFPLGTNNLSFPAGASRAAASILPLATDGSGTVGVTNSSDSNHHLIVDVNGYFL
jgi:hypothetical protein